MKVQVGETGVDLSHAPQALSAMRRIGDGYKVFQVVQAGFRSGLFDWLAQHGPADRPAISAALHLRGAHLAGFLQALEDQALLVRIENRYALADGMDQVLCHDSPWNQGAVFDGMLSAASGWSALDRFLGQDWSPAGDTQMPLPSPQHPFSGEAQRLVQLLAQHQALPQGQANVLCFDGGEGQLAVALCQHCPESHVTVVVPDHLLKNTEATIAASGVAARCTVMPGSPLAPPQGAYALVVLFHALYAVRRTTNDALAAVAGRLAPGGRLYCAHWFCLEACDTAPGGLRDLDKAVLTDSHPMCHVETFCQRFDPIGLVSAGQVDLQGEYGVTKLHIAQKPMDNQE